MKRKLPTAVAGKSEKPKQGKNVTEKKKAAGSLAEIRKSKNLGGLAQFAEQNSRSQDQAVLAHLAARSAGLNATESDNEVENRGGTATVQTRRAFAAHLNKALNESDVVVEVLDARDPEGFRSRAMEERVMELGKKLVLVLNKIDLVDDQTVVEGWEKYLKQSHPCVTFRAMTAASRSKQSSAGFSKQKATRAPEGLLHSGYEALGAADLMSVLKNYARTDDEKQRVAAAPEMDEPETKGDAKTEEVLYKNIIVSVVGMPNVGKSSIINSLCRNSDRVRTGNEAGVTRTLARIRLTRNIELLDTPGVIMEGDENDPAAVLRGCVKVYSDDTAEEAVNLLRMLPGMVQQLAKRYEVSESDACQPDVRMFLSAVADKKGKLKKGGARDVQASARIVIDDWKNGKLTSYARPPQQAATQSSVVVVQGPSKELDLDNL